MAETLPALSLHQPWASLIACGAKPFETRHWPAREDLIGQRWAIHAAKRPVPRHLRDPNSERGARMSAALRRPLNTVPTGAVVAIALLRGCYRLSDVSRRDRDGQGHPFQVVEVRGAPLEIGLRTQPPDGIGPLGWILADPFGSFTAAAGEPPRWCWHFVDVEPLKVPMTARGYQGIWRWAP
jgi:hypothetical protein